MRARLSLAILLCSTALAAGPLQVAVTIDDLPRGGDGPCEFVAVEELTRRLLQPFHERRIPVIGFVNEGRCFLTDAEFRKLLALWLEGKGTLGNHTYSHLDLNRASVAAFEQDLLKGERLTRELMREHGQDLRYLRHPFLHVGLTPEKRRDAEKMLRSRGYTVAPVTLDNSDYLFAAVYADALRRADPRMAGRVRDAYLAYMDELFAFFEQRTVEVMGRPIPQVLLLHVNELNARAMPDLLAMMQRRGYRFVPLSEALADPAYGQPHEYAGQGGFSWIHQWSITRGMPNKGEPEPPEWIVQEAGRVARQRR
jgi:peptidoglycan/xylan/chitin deacetylase (PgdA/CDA1 family)